MHPSWLTPFLYELKPVSHMKINENLYEILLLVKSSEKIREMFPTLIHKYLRVGEFFLKTLK